MKPILTLLVILFVCGCAAEENSSLATENGIATSVGNTNDKRAFEKREKQVYRVKTEVPLKVGFTTDLPEGLAEELKERADQSGVFADNYSGEVSLNAGGCGIGSTHGGYIVMKPENGLLEFTFTSHLDFDQEFEVYAISVDDTNAR